MAAFWRDSATLPSSTSVSAKRGPDRSDRSRSEDARLTWLGFGPWRRSPGTRNPRRPRPRSSELPTPHAPLTPSRTSRRSRLQLHLGPHQLVSPEPEAAWTARVPPSDSFPSCLCLLSLQSTMGSEKFSTSARNTGSFQSPAESPLSGCSGAGVARGLVHERRGHDGAV